MDTQDRPVGGNPAKEAALAVLAARDEAGRGGDAEVGPEHLLLGLVGLGGPAARVLADAGAGAHALRTAARLQDGGAQDGGLLGAGLPLSPAVRAVVEAAPRRGDDRVLLRTLLDADGGRVQELLRRAGADVGAVRAALDGGAPAGSAAPVPRPAPSVHRGGVAFEHEQVVECTPERLWPMLSDPARRPEWDHTAGSVTVGPDGVQRVSRRVGDGERPRVVEQVVTVSDPGREIAWRHVGARVGSFPGLHLRLVAVDGGTRVHLRADCAAKGRVGRLLARWVVSTELRMLGQSIARAASRTP
ncbi:hypothetical protein NUM3379_14590 [Kineococcus sp. NUM-3379]